MQAGARCRVDRSASSCARHLAEPQPQAGLPALLPTAARRVRPRALAVQPPACPLPLPAARERARRPARGAAGGRARVHSRAALCLVGAALPSHRRRPSQAAGGGYQGASRATGPNGAPPWPGLHAARSPCRRPRCAPCPPGSRAGRARARHPACRWGHAGAAPGRPPRVQHLQRGRAGERPGGCWARPGARAGVMWLQRSQPVLGKGCRHARQPRLRRSPRLPARSPVGTPAVRASSRL